ncbi:MAG: adenylate/guanylate cyclase domain-containing protein [Desulfobacterales bacterium]
MLFADVAGYTSISEKLDPEIVHQLMDGCFKILMEEIHKHEGTINQFTGDGIMALFGAPLAHEDHAQRACYAALSIQRALVNYEKKINKNFAVEFRMRIGLHQLSKKSSTELIHSILREGRPVPELKELILDRAAGNPLYMEEFTHTLVECGAIRCEDQKCMLTKDASGIQVPDTIQGIIAARMDRLEDDLKRTMQVASVIGRDFAFRKKAEQINDTGIMASTGGFLCLLYWWSGECRRVIDLAPKIITLLENAGRQSDFFGNPYNLYSVIHAWYANCSAMLGNFEEATSHIEKGIGVKSPIRAGIFLPGRALFGCG